MGRPCQWGEQRICTGAWPPACLRLDFVLWAAEPQEIGTGVLGSELVRVRFGCSRDHTEPRVTVRIHSCAIQYYLIPRSILGTGDTAGNNLKSLLFQNPNRGVMDIAQK